MTAPAGVTAPAVALFAEAVRREREARGWAPNELAWRAGVTPGTVRSIEEQLHAPTLTRVQMIADAFGMTVADLLQDPQASPGNACSPGVSPGSPVAAMTAAGGAGPASPPDGGPALGEEVAGGR